MKRNLIAVTIIVAVIIIFNFGYNFYKEQSFKNKTNNYIDYYKKLIENCKLKDSQNCCISSVQYMEKGNYKLYTNLGCSKGFQENMLLCIDSYKWCEPIK